MPPVSACYTNDINPGTAPQIFIGNSNLSGAHAVPVHDGRMEEVDRIGDRVLLYNPQSGNYWDQRPVHGRWIVRAADDAAAIRVFRERRW